MRGSERSAAAGPSSTIRPHCDFLSINAPMTPATRKWVNAERIAKMPKGAIVVNTARGGVVDDEALISALKSGRLAAAGIDVFEGEPKIHQGYYDLVNAFLLPHMGSATVETRNAMASRRSITSRPSCSAGRRHLIW